MAFKTKREKYAFVKGIKKGMKGGKPYGKRKPKKKPCTRSTNPFGMTYHQMLREREHEKRSLMGDGFERDSRGRIKGSYTVDGFFEPD